MQAQKGNTVAVVAIVDQQIHAEGMEPVDQDVTADDQ